MIKKVSKPKEKKTKFNPSDYEGYQYGPLILERYGKYVQLSSNWDPQEHKEYLGKITANQSNYKFEIDTKIKELFKIAENYNPLELLSALAPENVFANPETFKESTSEIREHFLEYALNVVLAVKNPNLSNHATEEAIEKFKTLISEIFNDLIWYFAIDNLKHDDESQREIRYKSLLTYLMLRGDSYPQHHVDLIKGLFKPHDAFFIKHYGFDTENVIAWVDSIEEQIVDSLEHFISFSVSLHETHELWVKFVDEKGIDSFSSVEESIKAFDSLPEIQAKRKELEEKYKEVDYIIFEITPNEKLSKDFLDLISAQFGDNEAFVSFKKFPGWATNDSIIYRKPLILHDGKYYCFSIQVVYRNLINLLEAFIREKDTNYFKKHYQKARGNFLVKKSLEYLKNILPDAEVYENLYYRVGGERAETDGIIIFDSCIFIVEGKAGSLTTSARRGSLDRLKSNISDLVGNAYEQALRTKKFIDENQKPRFEYENGTEALLIADKQKFKSVCLINVTLDNLGHLTSDLNNLKNLNLLQGKEWIWSVFINDLRIISEIVETPSEFLVYLQRRLRANDFPQFEVADELDYFMYYLHDGLYFENGWLEDDGVFRPHAYTQSLDRYYHHELGIVSSGEKPILKIPEKYKELIKKIETTKKSGFSEVTTQLLSFDVATMEEILDKIEWAKTTSLTDVIDHDFTMTFGLDLGLTIAIFSKEKGRSIESTSEYCSLKMYQLKIKRWIFLAIDIRNRKEEYSFRLFNKEWIYNPKKEAELEVFRNRKLQHHFSFNRKVKPNELCPCNSGEKFKKCCSYKFR
jgi:SEC-C motif